MTDCDVPDSALQEVADVALAHLPNGSQAWVERGLGGLPHRLFVRPAWLDASAFVVWPEGHAEPLRSCEFYDRLAPVRWLCAVVEGAAIALRGNLAYLERQEVAPDVLKTETARLALLGTIVGGLSALRRRLEADGAALRRVERPCNTISVETMREMGVSPMGSPS